MNPLNDALLKSLVVWFSWTKCQVERANRVIVNRLVPPKPESRWNRFPRVDNLPTHLGSQFLQARRTFFCLLFVLSMDPLRGGRRGPFWYKTVSILLFTNENQGGQRSKIVSPKALLIFRHFGLNIEQTYEIIHVSYTTFPKHLMRNVISFSSINSAESYYHFVQL